MVEKLSEIVTALVNALGSENVISDVKTLETMLDNTLGVKRQAKAVVYPLSTEDVEKIIGIANKYLTPLHAVSRGKNVGYGDIAPVSDGHVIVDLRKMNKIYGFDNRHGTVYVQPGVSQGQLNDFLKANDSRFWMDATGSGLDASIVGNSLEGGFGHTPKGNRRRAISDLQVVLGNGTVLQTGIFPGLGPDLSALFVQSNFGIVTSIKVKLMPIPERYESFIIKVKNDRDLEALVDTISELKRQNILTSLVHIANAVRSMVSTRTCPDGFENKILTSGDAVKIMSTPLVKVGYWTALGGIYGTCGEIKIKKRKIRQSFKFADVMFISDGKLNLLRKIFNHNFMLPGLRNSLNQSIKALEYVHGLGKGVPSNQAFDNIKWRVKDDADMGLLWYSPTYPANGTDSRRVVKDAEALFNEYGFELPVTMTLISPDRIVGIISISFDKSDKGQCKKAHDLFNALNRKGAETGINSYRKPVTGMDIRYDKNKAATFHNLKKALDPNGIIAPGRYGIGP